MKTTEVNYTPIQLKLPVDMERIIEINDSVYTFNEVVSHIDLKNTLYCQEHGMEKYMKFPMYEKETKDKKYRDDPYRAVNFRVNEAGRLVCPNGKEFFPTDRTGKGQPIWENRRASPVRGLQRLPTSI